MARCQGPPTRRVLLPLRACRCGHEATGCRERRSIRADEHGIPPAPRAAPGHPTSRWAPGVVFEWAPPAPRPDGGPDRARLASPAARPLTAPVAAHQSAPRRSGRRPARGCWFRRPLVPCPRAGRTARRLPRRAAVRGRHLLLGDVRSVPRGEQHPQRQHRVRRPPHLSLPLRRRRRSGD
jgi:hypothetical protein